MLRLVDLVGCRGRLQVDPIDVFLVLLVRHELRLVLFLVLSSDNSNEAAAEPAKATPAACLPPAGWRRWLAGKQLRDLRIY